MPYRIITISRAPYSGARHIARLVAAKLNLAYYDKELITLAARESGLSEEAIAASETQRSSSLLYSLSTLGSQLPLADQVYLVQSNVIKQVAEEGPCVIVGRCADYILRSKADCLKVFIHADLKFRAERIVKVYGEREQSPEERLRDKDKRRAAYHRFYTNMKWGHAQNYHLTLDSGVLGIDKCVEIIAELF